MEGVVNAMLQWSGILPQHYERARKRGAHLRGFYDERLARLKLLQGEPSFDPITDWYPRATTAASWRRDEKTLALILSQDGTDNAAVLLWCVTDDERATLEEATRTRPHRTAATEFDADFEQQIRHILEPGRHRSLSTRMLVDDLNAIPGRAEQLLAQAVASPEGEVRFVAAHVALALNGTRGVPAVLSLLDDPLQYVRHEVIGLLSAYADESVVGRLVTILQSDTDVQVRGVAAYSLGHIGSPAAIPHLINALDNDKEVDCLGHSPSSISATALDNILGTNQTRIKTEDGFCTMAPWPPDYDLLKRRATELYEEWKAAQPGG